MNPHRRDIAPNRPPGPGHPPFPRILPLGFLLAFAFAFTFVFAAPVSATERWDGIESEIESPWQGAVTTDAEWADLWKRAFGKKAPPVDFSKNFVAFAFLGHRAGWWYGISFREPAVRDGKLVVTYTLAALEVSATREAFRNPGYRGQYAMQVFPKREGLEVVVRGHSPERFVPGLGADSDRGRRPPTPQELLDGYDPLRDPPLFRTQPDPDGTVRTKPD